MTKPLDGRIALVTGGGAGMGRAHCMILAERGAHVIVQDLREGKARDTMSAIGAAGGAAEAMGGDVADVSDLRARLEAAAARLGHIDILVNNAGISGLQIPIEEIDEGIFDRMMAVHAKASFFTVQALVPGLLRTELTIESIGDDAVFEERAKTVPLGRLAEPSDIARTVAFLASPESDFMTGQTLSPSGGAAIVGI